MSATALPKAANALRDLGRFQDIPVVRQLGVFVLAAAAIALGLWLFFWTQKPDYVTVQAGLDAKSTAEASDALRTAQIPFKLDNATGALTVPADQAGAARMTMASAGITASNPAGYESLQGDQGFGTSQFVENARYQHAMEIELARTITQLRPVREARVHLAMPKPSAFTRQNEPASASVVLQLNAGQSLEQNQIDAIERLVASSVSDLSPQRVTVVDQFGRLLSEDDPTSEEAVSNKQFEQQRRQEAMYVQRIEELLAPLTGPGRVSAKVSVDMDFAQTEQASETYGPQPAIVRSEQLSESGNLSASNTTAQGVPGSASNTPTPANTTTPAAPANGAAPAANATAATNANGGQGTRSSVRNYEIDRTLTHTRQATPRVRRVTAAVLVDNVAGAPAATGKPAASRALNDAELKRIETLVQQAIGFDQQRGDVVSVVNAPFAPVAIDAPDTSIPLWKDPQNINIARLALGGLAVLGLIIFVLRPAFRSMLSPRGANGSALVPVGAGGPQVMPTVTAEMVDDDEVPVKLSPAYSPKPALPPAPGFDQKLQSARDVASADPKRVAQVVREMVASDG